MEGQAQTYTTTYSAFVSGYLKSTSGSYTHRAILGGAVGTRAQHDDYRTDPNLVGFLIVIATPGAPKLTIRGHGNIHRVSWPAETWNFVLEYNVHANAVLPWTGVAGPYQSNGTDFYVDMPTGKGKRFYRLRKL